MKITIGSVGKPHPPYDSLEQEYLKRFSGGLDVERRFVKNDSELLKLAESHSGHLVLLTEQGKGYGSTQFAARLGQWQAEAQPLLFLLGGAEGLPAELLEQGHDQLSLSPMTMPHELAAVVVIEQLYRAQTILSGHPYHKG